MGVPRLRHHLGPGLTRPRAVSVARSARDGRSVIENCGAGTSPGAIVTRQRWTSVASTSTASSIAKLLPMHSRGPPPNG